jgi:hypothetical protein
MKKIAVALVITLSTFVSAQAQSRFVVEGQNDFVYRESVATYGDNNGLTALGWWKFVGKYDNDKSDKYLIQVHCSSRLFRFIRIMEYRQGRATYNSGENWSAQWQNPVPGTLTEFFQDMCTVR